MESSLRIVNIFEPFDAKHFCLLVALSHEMPFANFLNKFETYKFVTLHS